MNIFFACLLFAIAFSFGIERAVEESAAGPNAKLIVAEVIADSPAAESGIPLGSTIISLQAGNETISNQLLPSTFSEFVSLHASEQITIKYRHNGEVNSVELYPAAGVIDNEPDKLAVGMALAMSEKVSESIPVAIWHAIKMTCTTLVAITVGIVGLLANAVQLKADLSAVAGPVGIVGLVGDAAEFGLISLMMFTAFISLNLAVINLLPFPALDGGRLLFVAIEGIIRRPINSVWVARVNLAGFAFLLLLMLAVTYNDILRIL